MTRDEIIELITQVVGDELTLMRTDVERLIAAKPLPPFVPPPIWAAGRTSASVVVRHANGLFMARRDTEAEPPGDDWLPLLVGVAGLVLGMHDRTLMLRMRLSDGGSHLLERKLAVPLLRGVWSADADYEEGDRVMCSGEWQAIAPSTGVEPGTEGSEAVWFKVGGKTRPPGSVRDPQFMLDDDGNLTESGRTIGTIKPLVRELLVDLVAKHAK